jgi:hypothetical protein
MDRKIAEEFLDELFSSLEAQETQSAAVLQFLKDHGNATDEQLAPYMEQASKASNVRWRATRLRLMSLLTSAVKSAEEASAKGSQPEKDQEFQQKKDRQKASPQEKHAPEDEATKENAPSPSAKKATEPSSKDEAPKAIGEDRSNTEVSRETTSQQDTSKKSPPSRDEAAKPTGQDHSNAEVSRKTASPQDTSKESSQKSGKKDAA